MTEPERKTAVRVEIKDEEKGIVTAVFSKLGVKDKDGDVTLPGAFGKQNVMASAYGHGSWMGDLPVGRGTISEKGDEAIAELKFFMSTTHGREHFEVVKGMGELQEWSFGYDVKETGEVTEEMRQQGVARVLKSLDVHEVSPVMHGAGVDTRTLATKKENGEKPVEEKTMTKTELGTLIKTLRDENELSNGDLAEAMGTTSTQVAKIIEGTPHRSSLKRLEKAAVILKTSLSRLRAAAETDGHDYADEDEWRSRGAAAEEAREAGLKAQELVKSAEREARASIEAKTAAEATAALERAEAYQDQAQSEFQRLNRNMERYTT